MAERDIRWQQRYKHFVKAYNRLKKAARLADSRALSELEEQGMIKVFEFTFELGWNVLKDILEYQGATRLIGSRDTIRAAFKVGLLDDGETWMDMLASRNLSSHTYDEQTVHNILSDIQARYLAVFDALLSRGLLLLEENP